MNLAYCDMIAHAIKDNIAKVTDGNITSSGVDFDLAKEGYMQSTSKFLTLTDWNGKQYKVTVEECK